MTLTTGYTNNYNGLQRTATGVKMIKLRCPQATDRMEATANTRSDRGIEDGRRT